VAARRRLGPVNEREAIAAIWRARDLGINLFDTAQANGFGASARLLGRALAHELRDHRDEIVIATKAGCGDRIVGWCAMRVAPP
jgi:aryl-alcohol dehydrogenase-like predicted oxidoreductase